MLNRIRHKLELRIRKLVRHSHKLELHCIHRKELRSHMLVHHIHSCEAYPTGHSPWVRIRRLVRHNRKLVLQHIRRKELRSHKLARRIRSCRACSAGHSPWLRNRTLVRNQGRHIRHKVLHIRMLVRMMEHSRYHSSWIRISGRAFGRASQSRSFGCKLNYRIRGSKLELFFSLEPRLPNVISR
jgi:hypothetical protein